MTAAPLVCEVFAWFVVFCGGRKVAGAARSVGRDARRESSPWGAHPTGAKIQGSYRRQSEAQSRHAYLRGHRLGYAFPQRFFAIVLILDDHRVVVVAKNSYGSISSRQAISVGLGLCCCFLLVIIMVLRCFL